MNESRNLTRLLIGTCVTGGLIGWSYAMTCLSKFIEQKRELQISAEKIAVLEYGDGKKPFTGEERDLWYVDMKIPSYRRPNVQELRNYIESHTDKNK